MKPRKYLFAIVVSAVFFGCEKEQATTTSPAEAVEADASSKGAALPPEAESEPAIEKAAVLAQIESWLAAQNEGDFEAYAEHYAPKFEGIKRVGTRTSSYDRKSWLEDRKRMFEKKMNVKAEDIRVDIAGAVAIATFTQTWQSGDYRDIGPKQLVFVAGDDEPKISREEMLESRIVDADAKIPYDPIQVAVMHSDEFVFLSQDATGLENTSPRPLRELKMTGAMISTIADVKSPPERLAQFVGKEFAVHSSKKPALEKGTQGKGNEWAETCEAKVKSVHVVAEATPHFGMVNHWRENDASKEKVAESIWEMVREDRRVVVGKLDKKCPGATWAHGKPAAHEAYYRVEKLEDEKLRKVVVDEFRKLAGYKEEQKRHEAERGGEKPWEEVEGTVDVYGLVGPEGQPQFAAIKAHAGQGCGAFEASFWAAMSLSGGSASVITDARNPGPSFAPAAAVKIGGELWVVADDGRLFRTGEDGKLEKVADFEPPFFDCTC